MLHDIKTRLDAVPEDADSASCLAMLTLHLCALMMPGCMHGRWVVCASVAAGIISFRSNSKDTVFCCLLPLLQLGRTLVFETVDQGAQYRQYAIKALRASVPDIVTLDGGKLSGRGVVLGSGFRVCKIEEAQCRFGTIPASHQVSSVLADSGDV